MNLKISFWPDSEPTKNFETAVRGWFNEYGTGSFHFPKPHFNRDRAKLFSWTVSLKEGDVLMAIHALHQKLYLLGVSFEVQIEPQNIEQGMMNAEVLKPQSGKSP